MLAIVIALLIVSNAITYFLCKPNKRDNPKLLSEQVEQLEQSLAEAGTELKDLKQALADSRYKASELEKDLAQAKRKH